MTIDEMNVKRVEIIGIINKLTISDNKYHVMKAVLQELTDQIASKLGDNCYILKNGEVLFVVNNRLILKQVIKDSNIIIDTHKISYPGGFVLNIPKECKIHKVISILMSTSNFNLVVEGDYNNLETVNFITVKNNESFNEESCVYIDSFATNDCGILHLYRKKS